MSICVSHSLCTQTCHLMMHGASQAYQVDLSFRLMFWWHYSVVLTQQRGDALRYPSRGYGLLIRRPLLGIRWKLVRCNPVVAGLQLHSASTYVCCGGRVWITVDLTRYDGFGRIDVVPSILAGRSVHALLCILVPSPLSPWCINIY
jgi:hypothetical protein